ncbi:hypothetical protein BZL30_7840 [Mycobacterium kansasii]|uniref:Uncharacterized protein n=1 Tax=Mycobacterium kansasii TaxID=1768 RepID=A0A1V3WM95_MYCKA|nr:hypothetical protein BZL30_7840 [Mycobacterium kansasii]
MSASLSAPASMARRAISSYSISLLIRFLPPGNVHYGLGC